MKNISKELWSDEKEVLGKILLYKLFLVGQTAGVLAGLIKSISSCVIGEKNARKQKCFSSLSR